MGRFSALFGRPAFLRAFHGWCTLVWFVLIPVTVCTGLKTSILWIALMSVWANFVGHFSSWQAARVEVKQDEQIEDVAAPARALRQPVEGSPLPVSRRAGSSTFGP
ncbi:hypothetical protein [Streptomyces sp. NRRL S-350]|uniref:hypothetical protein n=1 Tax=Streptomyces sp. NRRL S-350 TaxID=1463902 RepID=UPI0004C0FB08|nr:hypothetical protein [Streptomyces sp. NRRL S-350]